MKIISDRDLYNYVKSEADSIYKKSSAYKNKLFYNKKVFKNIII